MWVMNRKIIAIVFILGVSLALGVTLRSANRADAAGGDCYSAVQGPATPTICK
jgi:hypothetical protein